MHHPKFGALPSGNLQKRIEQSPNFRDGQFQNLNHTPDLTEGVTYYQVFKEFFFTKKTRLKPEAKLPNNETNLILAIASHKNITFSK